MAPGADEAGAAGPGGFLGLLWLRLTGGSPEQGLGCGEALGFSPRASFSFRQALLCPGRLNLLVRARDSPGAPSPSLEERPAAERQRISRSFALPVRRSEAEALAVRRLRGQAERTGSADSSAPGAGEPGVSGLRSSEGEAGRQALGRVGVRSTLGAPEGQYAPARPWSLLLCAARQCASPFSSVRGCP